MGARARERSRVSPRRRTLHTTPVSACVPLAAVPRSVVSCDSASSARPVSPLMVSESAFPWVASDVQHQLTAAIQRFPSVRELLSIQVRLQSNDPIRWPEARDIAYQVLGSSHPLTRSLERWLRDDQPALRLARHRDAATQGDVSAPGVRASGSEWGLMFPELHMAPPEPSRDPSLHLRPHLPALMDPPPASPPEPPAPTEEAMPAAHAADPLAPEATVQLAETPQTWRAPVLGPASPIDLPEAIEPEPTEASPGVMTDRPLASDPELAEPTAFRPNVVADPRDARDRSGDDTPEDPLPVLEDLEPLEDLLPLEEPVPAPAADVVEAPFPTLEMESSGDVSWVAVEQILQLPPSPEPSDDLLAPEALSSLVPEHEEGTPAPTPAAGMVFPALVLQQLAPPAPMVLPLGESPAADHPTLDPVDEGPTVPALQAVPRQAPTEAIAVPASGAIAPAAAPAERAASSRLRSLQARLNALKTSG